jgi:hypothetical protein
MRYKADLSRVLQDKYGESNESHAIIGQVWTIITKHHTTASGIKQLITQIEFLLGDRDRRGFYDQGMPKFFSAGLACPPMGSDVNSPRNTQRLKFLEFAADAVFADILQQVGTLDPQAEPMSKGLLTVFFAVRDPTVRVLIRRSVATAGAAPPSSQPRIFS